MATLGVVELFIHLLQEYSSGIDKDKKALFADIHFMLFYTAIFNAFQSVLLAVLTRHISNKMWVRTEELELSHYVELRIEYENVHKKLYGHAPMKTNSRSSNTNTNKSQPEQQQENQTQQASNVINDNQSCCQSINGFCRGLLHTMRYPQLKSRYNELLVQVRFHELRVHFLQAYDLPLKLKVSDYLMNSEQHVLTHLVHVSTSAWLWLTGLVNVLYFVTGMIVDTTGNSESAATALSIIFFLGMVLGVAASVLVYHRMKYIFMRIM